MKSYGGIGTYVRLGPPMGIDRDRVTGPDQLLAVLDPLGHRLPVARLLRQAGQISGNRDGRRRRSLCRQKSALHTGAIRVGRSSFRGYLP